MVRRAKGFPTGGTRRSNDLMSMRIQSGPAALLLLLLAAATARAEESLAEITGDSVRVRSGPSTMRAILAELDRGDLVVVLGAEDGWRRVRVPGGLPGYVHSSLVSIGEDGVAVVAASRVLLRPEAGKDQPALDERLDEGERLPVLDRDGEWVKVLMPERVEAFVYGEFLREIGPVAEHADRAERAARARRERLLSGRTEEEQRLSTEKRRQEDREAVLAIGEKILDGEGDAEQMEERLRRVVLESDDDLTRGYANSLLALLELRKESERLRAEVEAAKKEKNDTRAGLESQLAEARRRYAEALDKVRVLRSLRENPFRGVGRIEKRGEDLVLVEDGRVLYKLLSRRFRLEDYVGRRVGVNGRMVAKEPGENVSHLMVEKIAVLEPKPDDR